jgi:hypothetical protein
MTPVLPPVARVVIRDDADAAIPVVGIFAEDIGGARSFDLDVEAFGFAAVGIVVEDVEVAERAVSGDRASLCRRRTGNCDCCARRDRDRRKGS